MREMGQGSGMDFGMLQAQENFGLATMALRIAPNGFIIRTTQALP